MLTVADGGGRNDQKLAYVICERSLRLDMLPHMTSPTTSQAEGFKLVYFN